MNIRFLGFMCAFIVMIMLASHAAFLNRAQFLHVSFLDVGQGDAIYIRAPNGNDILIDGGPNDRIIHELGNVMSPFDRTIDMVIATHPDKDHIAGLVPVFEMYSVGTFVASEISADTHFDTMLRDAITNEQNLETVIARRGQRFILDKNVGIYLDILFPDQNTTLFDETNEASMIMRLVYGEQSFLLTGDAPNSVEQFIARTDRERIQSDVFKLGHHGSRTSNSDELLEYVSPVLGIVSAGEGNTYNHPHPFATGKFSSRGIPVLSTIESGTITLVTDGQSLWRE